MKESEKNEKIKQFLDMFNVNNIDDLPDYALPDLIDMLQPQYNVGSVSTIYNESNDKEKKQLLVDIKKCINDNKTMSLYVLSNEGVANGNNNGYFAFCSQHSIWYEII